MSILNYLFVYLVSLAAFLVIDLTWLGVVARGFYRDQLGNLLAPAVNWPAAIIFYCLFVLGVVIFAVLPGLRADSLWTAIGFGAMFGFLAYATYDLTNLATLKDWPFTLALVDMAWGAVLSGSVAAIGYAVANQLRN